MRQIKFRAWDTMHKVMLPSVAVYQNAENIGIPLCEADEIYTDEQMDGDGHIYGCDDWIYVMNEFELMQFAEWTDNHTKDIYEGDIIRGVQTKISSYGKAKNKDFVGVVEWQNAGFSIRIFDQKVINSFAGSTRIFFSPLSITTINILGNIYENPELLQP